MKLYPLLAAISLVGCSAVPVGGPAIIIVRDAGYIGSDCTQSVILDGKMAGSIKSGASLIIPSTNGKHNVTIYFGGECNVTKSLIVELKDNDSAILRSGSSSDNFQPYFESN